MSSSAIIYQDTDVNVSTQSWVRPRHACFVFLTYFISQFVVIFLIDFLVGFILGFLGLWETHGEETLRMLQPYIVLTGMIGSGFLLIQLTARAARRSGEEDWGQTIGWLPVKGAEVGLGFASGVVLCLTYLVLAVLWFPPPPDLPTNVINEMMASSGLSKVIWGLLIVGIGPIIEEHLFRGVIFMGFEQSCGTLGSGLLVTAIFVLVHVPQTLTYPFAWLSLGLLSLLTVWLRIRTHSIVPSIALHSAYNTTLVGIALLASSVS